MMALTWWALRHANSSSKSFVTFSVDLLLPLMSQDVDEGDALVRRHLPIRLAVGFVGFSKRVELADANISCHKINYSARLLPSHFFSTLCQLSTTVIGFKSDSSIDTLTRNRPSAATAYWGR